MKKYKLITQKLKDQVAEDNNPSITYNSTCILGTILIALSGLILYLDKAFGFFNISFAIPEKFTLIGYDFNTFIWFMAQTVSPLLLIFGSLLKHYKVAYVLPLYFYILQLYYVLFDFKIIDDGYYIIYSIGTSVIILMIIHTIKRLSKKYILSKIKKEKQRLLDELH